MNIRSPSGGQPVALQQCRAGDQRQAQHDHRRSHQAQRTQALADQQGREQHRTRSTIVAGCSTAPCDNGARRKPIIVAKTNTGPAASASPSACAQEVRPAPRPYGRWMTNHGSITTAAPAQRMAATSGPFRPDGDAGAGHRELAHPDERRQQPVENADADGRTRHARRAQPLTARMIAAQRSRTGRIVSAFSEGRLVEKRG